MDTQKINTFYCVYYSEFKIVYKKVWSSIKIKIKIIFEHVIISLRFLTPNRTFWSGSYQIDAEILRGEICSTMGGLPSQVWPLGSSFLMDDLGVILEGLPQSLSSWMSSFMLHEFYSSLDDLYPPFDEFCFSLALC